MNPIICPVCGQMVDIESRAEFKSVFDKNDNEYHTKQVNTLYRIECKCTHMEGQKVWFISLDQAIANINKARYTEN